MNTDKSVYSPDDASVLLYNKFYQFGYSAGGIFSTADEFNIFMKSLFDYALISEDSLNKMIYMNKDSYYGYGIAGYFLLQDESSNILFYGHNSVTDNYQTCVMYSPEIELGIAVIIKEKKIVPEDCVYLLFETVLDAL